MLGLHGFAIGMLIISSISTYVDKVHGYFCYIILQEIIDSLVTNLIAPGYSPIAQNVFILKLWLHKIC